MIRNIKETIAYGIWSDRLAGLTGSYSTREEATAAFNAFCTWTAYPWRFRLVAITWTGHQTDLAMSTNADAENAETLARIKTGVFC